PEAQSPSPALCAAQTVVLASRHHLYDSLVCKLRRNIESLCFLKVTHRLNITPRIVSWFCDAARKAFASGLSESVSKR
ncbi:MAG: hypothetical protein E7H06_07585, partial [Enterobacter asburiae]|nr:hypothetical protein [Enterobacter asburiae]